MLKLEQLTVLIVDDDPVNLAFLGAVCESLGMLTITTGDPWEALQHVARQQCHVIIADWDMPNMKGLELCRLVRQHKMGADAYFILVSAEDGEGYIKACLDAQVDQFIPKPIPTSVLKISLRNASKVMGLQNKLITLNQEIPQTRRNLENDLYLLRLVQLQMMPRNCQTIDRTQVFVYSKPYSILSGDQCGAFQVDENHFAFYLVDVVGHGIPAAIRAFGFSRLVSPLHGESVIFKPDDDCSGARKLRPCSEVLSILNEVYLISEADDAYVCAIYGVIDRRTMELCISIAGMPPPFVYSQDGSVRPIGNADLPLGIEPQLYTQSCIRLNVGDQIVLFSDGLIEARNQNNQLLGVDGFKKILEDNADWEPKQFGEQITRHVLDWSGLSMDDTFQDDLTLFAVSPFPEFNRQNSTRAFKAVPGNLLGLPSLKVIAEEMSPLRSELTKPIQGKPARQSRALLIIDDVAIQDQLLTQLGELDFETQCLPPYYFVRAEDLFLKDVEFVFIEASDRSYKAAKWVQLVHDMSAGLDPYIVICYSQNELKQADELGKMGADNFLRFPCDIETLAFVTGTARRHLAMRQHVEHKTRQLTDLRLEIETDMKKVSAMQLRTLPREIEGINQLSFKWLYKPAEYVSGDFLSVFKISPGVVGFYVLDAVGQGMLASIKGWAVARMIGGVDKFNAGEHVMAPVDGRSGLWRISSPSRVLSILNQNLLEMPKTYQLGCSLVYGTLDCESGHGVLSYANFPTAFISGTDGEISLLKGKGPKLGAVEKPEFQDVSFVLRPGERLHLYTDGLPQTLGCFENSESVTPEFKAYMSSLSSSGMQESIASLNSRLSVKPAEKPRDASMLMIELGNIKPIIQKGLSVVELLDKYQPILESTLMSCQVPQWGTVFNSSVNDTSVLNLSQKVKNHLEEILGNEGLAAEIALCVVELGKNIRRVPRFGRKKEIQLDVALLGCKETLVCLISDNGEAIDALALDHALTHSFEVEYLSAGPEGSIGPGLSLASKLVDYISYSSDSGGNHFCLIKNLPVL